MSLHPDRVTECLRQSDEPVILRTLDDGLLFDVRTLEDEELEAVAGKVARVINKECADLCSL